MRTFHLLKRDLLRESLDCHHAYAALIVEMRLRGDEPHGQFATVRPGPYTDYALDRNAQKPDG